MFIKKLVSCILIYVVALGAAQAGIRVVKSNGITLTGADGITLTGADGGTFTGTNGITLTGADGITLTGADGITLTGADEITLTGADNLPNDNTENGLQSVDPELAILLNNAADDSNINAIIVFHQYPSPAELAQLRQIGITGGTLYKILPLIMVSATRTQLIFVSQMPQVRSIYGNRTLTLNSDSFFKNTQIQSVMPDRDLQLENGGMPVSGRGVTVAVLDTGINAAHNDLSGKVVQNVRLADVQSSPAGFLNPVPVENLVNTDFAGGHGTFVSGIIAASGISTGGKFNGVAPGVNVASLRGTISQTSVLGLALGSDT